MLFLCEVFYSSCSCWFFGFFETGSPHYCAGKCTNVCDVELLLQLNADVYLQQTWEMVKNASYLLSWSYLNYVGMIE